MQLEETRPSKGETESADVPCDPVVIRKMLFMTYLYNMSEREIIVQSCLTFAVLNLNLVVPLTTNTRLRSLAKHLESAQGVTAPTAG